MSFLYRSNVALRSAVAARPSPRLFSTAVVYRKSATETVKDSLKAVDRTVSDNLVKGIDASVEAKNKAAEVAGMEASKAKGAAQEKAGQAKGAAQETAGQAKGAAQETAGQAKGKAAEMKGEAVGRKEEIKAKM